ncbi:serine/threonine protein kinase [Streptomonospora sp. S1-112]|uniref:Serine/threonine protein kinase n=1 Tax=Streptomonospora mangrovi TaxID=2883123 RepID=A0A9X3NFU5_9ACTN|nr:serine/threonine-protein kinase [Streptomonospora mangrovi]MDA0562849.1 serine/threonine protein kinase [Streptomonospora mangrovi]
MLPLEPTDPASIGGYRLQGRLGAGGMGQVYLAATLSGRHLAVKVIRPDLLQQGQARARFAREVDAARRVGGFHTAPVVDADVEADPPWVATAYIPGPSLFQAVRDDGPLTAPALHVLAVGLAEGLKAIHACGLVHRDLKPGNVIMTHDGPRIIDFGIARSLGAETLTGHDAVVGTLTYMSPEQVDGSGVGPASDVFSLGTVLAFAATGANPFKAETMAETVQRLSGPPPDPGDVDPLTRGLIADCWNRDSGARPTPDAILARFAEGVLHAPGEVPKAGAAAAAAGAAAAAARAPAGGEPGALRDSGAGPAEGAPAARPPEGGDPPPAGPHHPVPPPPGFGGAPPPRPAAKPSRRPPLWLILGGAAMAVLLVVATAVVWGTTLLLGETGVTGDGPGATGESGTEEPDEGAAGTPVPFPPGPEAVLPDPSVEVLSVAYNPDGSTVAVVNGDSGFHVMDARSGELVTTVEREGMVNGVAFSPDGGLLALADSFEDVALWDTGSEEDAATLDTSATAIAYSPDGALVATANGASKLWDAETGEETATLEERGNGVDVTTLAFSPAGGLIATAGNDDVVRLWDVESGEETAAFEHEDQVMSLAFSPDGATLAVGTETEHAGAVRLWDVEAGEETAELHHDGGVRSVAYSPNGEMLATAGPGVAVWDTGSQERIEELLPYHSYSMRSVAFHPDGTALAAGGDGVFQMWTVDATGVNPN